MLETAGSPADAKAPDTNAAERKLTDGFHLVIEALTLNGVKTIYGVPGIPITDLGRLAQASGIRVISFRTSNTPATPPPSPASSRRSPASASRCPRPASSTV